MAPKAGALECARLKFCASHDQRPSKNKIQRRPEREKNENSGGRREGAKFGSGGGPRGSEGSAKVLGTTRFDQKQEANKRFGQKWCGKNQKISLSPSPETKK